MSGDQAGAEAQGHCRLQSERLHQRPGHPRQLQDGAARVSMAALQEISLGANQDRHRQGLRFRSVAVPAGDPPTHRLL